MVREERWRRGFCWFSSAVDRDGGRSVHRSGDPASLSRQPCEDRPMSQRERSGYARQRSGRSGHARWDRSRPNPVGKASQDGVRRGGEAQARGARESNAARKMQEPADADAAKE